QRLELARRALDLASAPEAVSALLEEVLVAPRLRPREKVGAHGAPKERREVERFDLRELLALSHVRVEPRIEPGVGVGGRPHVVTIEPPAELRPVALLETAREDGGARQGTRNIARFERRRSARSYVTGSGGIGGTRRRGRRGFHLSARTR